MDPAGAEAREMILSVSHDDGNGCRSFDLELLASIVPPDKREAYLTFLEATQRPQGWAAMEQAWPGRSLPDVPCTYVLCTEDNVLPPLKQRGMAARLWSLSRSPPTMRSSLSVRASSRRCSLDRPIHASEWAAQRSIPR